MFKLPLVARGAVEVEDVTLANDAQTIKDELPTALRKDCGIVVAGKTRVTEVHRETTDDR